ncbi:Flp family type IVb pilin [Roseospira visakhapatnamensis]|uniref:Flp pilus assembly pilin Flp n=1 Tax=Roseospira visakhapatnamensis TaxID=390880 RepID=A0A7W6RF79_9PROT|nr:Flp family type IVb pilin [Roseospira visakhapatnamensis]MBB4267431.1 Flp pilus assembly pilin Flp [Roseospira visakhapatnamensis]
MIPPSWTGLVRLWCDDVGATAIEYALIALGIAMAVIGSVRLLGTALLDGISELPGYL